MVVPAVATIPGFFDKNSVSIHLLFKNRQWQCRLVHWSGIGTELTFSNGKRIKYLHSIVKCVCKICIYKDSQVDQECRWPCLCHEPLICSCDRLHEPTASCSIMSMLCTNINKRYRCSRRIGNNRWIITASVTTCSVIGYCRDRMNGRFICSAQWIAPNWEGNEKGDPRCASRDTLSRSVGQLERK